jgi:hypothetical protein
MDAVGAARGGDVGAVVDDEGGVARLHDRAQRVAGALQRVVVDVLETELDAGDVVGVERRGEPLTERLRIELRRRDEIEPTALVLLAQSCPL